MWIHAHRRHVKVVGALVLAASLAACGSDIEGFPSPGEIDIRQLDVGNYNTDPAEYRGKSRHSVAAGEMLDFSRLVDHVVIGSDVDEKFAHGLLSKLLPTPTHTTNVLTEAAKPILEATGMLYGFSAAASTHPLVDTTYYDSTGNFKPFGGADTNPEATSFNITVLRFPDADGARTAAEQIEAADFDVAPDVNARVTIDGVPTARAHWRPGVPSLAATVSYGSHLINVFVQQPTANLPELKSLAERVFAAQVLLLERMPVLSPRDSLLQPPDPHGVARRTLSLNDGLAVDADSNAIRTPRGWLHFVPEQRVWEPMLESSGVDYIATTKKTAILFRARDADAARSLYGAINGLESHQVEPPPLSRDIMCAENPQPKFGGNVSQSWDAGDRFLCTIRYDRYVARVAASQLTDAQQRASAQLALLAKSQYM